MTHRRSFLLWLLLLLAVLLLALVLEGRSAEVAVPLSSVSADTGSILVEAHDPGIPVRLRIPRLALDAPLQPVGVTREGNMQVPSDARVAGWFVPGVWPGHRGNAAIAAHLNTVLQRRGIFWDLDTMQLGDDVYIDTASGRTLGFRVQRMEAYDWKTAPLRQIFGTGAVARLQLITCNGTWVGSEHSYDKRLVVFTNLVSDTITDIKNPAKNQPID